MRNPILHQSEEASVDVISIMTVLKRSISWILLTSFLIAASVGVAQWFLNEEYYVSRATILASSAEIPMPGPSAISQFFGRAGPSNMELAQYEKILRTKALQNRVASRIEAEGLRGKIFATLFKVDNVSLEIEVRASPSEYARAVSQAYLDELAETVHVASSSNAKINENFIRERLKEAEASLYQLERDIPKMRASTATREMQIQSKIVLLLREQLETAQIETKKQQQSFRVIEPPTSPESPEGRASAKLPLMLMFLSIFFLSLLTIIRNIFKEEMDRRNLHVSSAVRK